MFQMIAMVLIAVLIILVFRFIRSPIAAVYTINNYFYGRSIFPRVEAAKRREMNVPEVRIAIGEGDLMVLRVIMALYQHILLILRGDAPPAARANMVRRYVYGVLATLKMRATPRTIVGFTMPLKTMVDAYSRQQRNMTERALAHFLKTLEKTCKAMLRELRNGEEQGLWPTATKVFTVLPVPPPTTDTGGGKAPVEDGVEFIPLRRPSTQVNPRACHVQWSSAVCVSD